MQRDVLRWIQSLDLSFPLKNPRRDLTNGFLAAEILSRYEIGKDIQMHSIDTGMALQRRLDNWMQIKKVLEKKRCKALTNELIEGVVQGREGAATDMLEQLYTLLTKKELKENVLAQQNKVTDSFLPGYARCTAAKILRDNNDETKERLSKLTGKRDEKTLHDANENLLEHHRVELQAMKVQEPDRFIPKAHPALDKAATEAKKPKIRQKIQIARELAVRTLDDSILNTFQQRDQLEKEEAFRAGFDENNDLGYSLSRVCMQPLQRFGVLDELDGRVSPHPQQDGSSSEYVTPARSQSGISGGNDYFTKFIDRRDAIMYDAKEATWSALVDAARNTAKLCMVRPTEFVHLTTTLGFLFKPSTALRDTFSQNNELDDQSGAVDRDHAIQFLCEVGAHCVKISPDTSYFILENYLVPSCLGVMPVAAPGIFSQLITMMVSFINTNHLDDLKRLISCYQLSLDTVNTADRFLLAVYHVLAQVDFAYCLGIDGLCQYYAILALSSPNNKSRIVAVLLLELLAHHSVELVLPLLNQILSLSVDPNWEVRINQLELLCIISQELQNIRPGSSGSNKLAPFDGATPPEEGVATNIPSAAQRRPSLTPDDNMDLPSGHTQMTPQQIAGLIPSVHAAIESTFDSFELTPLVHRKLSLRVLASYLHPQNEVACAKFLKRLLSLDDAVRASILSTNSSGANAAIPIEAISGRVRSFYVVGALTEVWNPNAVAQVLIREKSSFTIYDMLTVMEPLVLSTDLTSNPDFWLNILGNLKQDIWTAIFDPARMRGVRESDLAFCAEMAYSVTTKYYADLSGEQIEENGSFTEIQQNAVEWMQHQV